MDFVNFANQGNALDSINATTTLGLPVGCGDSTRGLFGGGAPAVTNVIQFIAFAFLIMGLILVIYHIYSSTGSMPKFNEEYSVVVNHRICVNTIAFCYNYKVGDGTDFGDLSDIKISIWKVQIQLAELFLVV